MAHRSQDDRGPLRFGDGPSVYRWSAIASAGLLFASLALLLGGVEQLGASLLGLSVVPFSAVNALNLSESTPFHVAYGKDRWWAFRYLPGTPIWLTRTGAGTLALTGLLVAVTAWIV